MKDFSRIDKRSCQRLMLDNRPLRAYDLQKDNLRVLGVKRAKPDWYEIFDWDYYDVLKKNGYVPSLTNMIALHNYLLETM
ncbi:hypothetical protein [Streptococcus hyointestinalis]|uniref:hypothetical protein n=1 Tax=Streptococcus hyointestinalis TaxID=1337 RepID=UPI0013DFF90B|nr:hypothetical protein [Streptococcus hyointestinalis]